MATTNKISLKTLKLLAILAIPLAILLHAQTPITGKWQGTTRNGAQIVLNLKAADGALTGTINREGQVSTITEGKVSKATITFKAILGEQTESLTGELDGEHLKVWLDRQDRDAAVVFSRVKE